MAFLAEFDDHTKRLVVHETGDTRFRVEVDEAAHEVDTRHIGPKSYSILIDGRSYVADVTVTGEQCAVTINGNVFRFRLVDEHRHSTVPLGAPEEERGRREIRAQMPGKVVDVLVSVGDLVESGHGLLVIEAMKMENEIKASGPGEVKEIRVTPGQAVEQGELLMIIE
jgi:biotin carboxyl carrier protein